MNLQARLGLLMAGLAAMSATVVGLVGYQLTASSFQGEIQKSLTDYTDQLLAAKAKDVEKICEPKVPKGSRKRDAAVKAPVPKGAPTGASIQCLSSTGIVTLSPQLLDLPVGEKDIELASEARGQTTIRGVTVEGRRYIMTTLATGLGAIQVAREVSENSRVLASLVKQFALLVVAAATLAAGAGALLTRRTVKPLVQLTASVENIAVSGLLNGPLPIPLRADEIGSLTTAFSGMLENLRRVELEQTQLVHDAGHELRSPLTSLRTNIGVLHRHPNMESDRRIHVVENLRNELAELTDLVDDLVLFAAGGESEGPLETVAFDDVVREVTQRWRHRSGRMFDLTIDSTERFEIAGHRRVLSRAVSNVIDNADKFSPVGFPVEIDLRCVGTSAVLTVTDHGKGVVPRDLTRVFDRFYRSTIHRDEPGSGLGLSIVFQAMNRYGGSVTVENVPAGGAQFSICLPVHHAPRSI